MERENFKKYAEAAIVEKRKKELYGINSCFEELYRYTFLLMGWRRYFCRIKQAECKRIFKQPRDLTINEITFFDGNLF